MTKGSMRMQKSIGAVLLSTLLVSGCASMGFKTTLADAQVSYSTAQEWWISTCIKPASHPAFCDDASTKSTVKHADAAATDAFQTATDAAKNPNLSPDTIASLTADAVSDMTTFATLINDLKGKH